MIGSDTILLRKPDGRFSVYQYGGLPVEDGKNAAQLLLKFVRKRDVKPKAIKLSEQQAYDISSSRNCIGPWRENYSEYAGDAVHIVDEPTESIVDTAAFNRSFEQRRPDHLALKQAATEAAKAEHEKEEEVKLAADIEILKRDLIKEATDPKQYFFGITFHMPPGGAAQRVLCAIDPDYVALLAGASNWSEKRTAYVAAASLNFGGVKWLYSHRGGGSVSFDRFVELSEIEKEGV